MSEQNKVSNSQTTTTQHIEHPTANDEGVVKLTHALQLNNAIEDEQMPGSGDSGVEKQSTGSSVFGIFKKKKVFRSDFKEKHTLAQRKAESERILKKYTPLAA